jgi:hypothetical protein
MIFQKGQNWNDYAPKYKRGRVIMKEHYTVNDVVRSRWVPVEIPIFSQQKDFISQCVKTAGDVFFNPKTHQPVV